MISRNGRQSAYSIDPMFLERWSPRAFTGEAMAEEQLMTLIEAGHWAPSASNIQPWRFVYALRGTPSFDTFLDLLLPGNQLWAGSASALLFIVSDSLSRRADGSSRPARSHSFDAGAAWAMFALQAHLSGYAAHGMGGVDFDRAMKVLNIPADYRIEAAVALGRIADKSVLPGDLQAREVPSQRKALSEIALEGGF
ncbi:nitroreductase family protein [Rhizobium halophytocola]|uniref:Nitroreductase n=1 Tax=Rhizobium halophytocola TaxID=735519 RepID=A0ABS4E1L9_9HYPH|nr:nitroreductase family protein [Rhizobium halophytocola]MBP1851838.1 nitroreductase [Rhizobium halophytocola]